MQLASLGHRLNQSPFNKKQLWTFVKIFLCIFSLSVYFVQKPNTPKEYLVSIFVTTAVVLISIVRVSTLFENANIFNFIDRIESTVNGSELNFYVLSVHI